MSKEVPLVQEIQKHQCLYNFNLPEYNRKDFHEEVWAEIAANVNLSVNECKDKWKNIRSSYVRSLKYTGSKPKKPYYLSSYLKFVVPYLKPLAGYTEVNSDHGDDDGETFDNTQNDDNLGIKIELVGDQVSFGALNQEVEIENPVQETRERPLIIRKRKRQPMVMRQPVNQRHRNQRQPFPSTTKSTRTDNTPMKYFLLSLLTEFDNMNADQIRTFKIKVMMLIDDIKSNNPELKKDLPSAVESERLQKRLINLLLKKIEST